jgi:hypothetical protein
MKQREDKADGGRTWRKVVKVSRGVDGVWFNKLACGHQMRITGGRAKANAKRRVCLECEDNEINWPTGSALPLAVVHALYRQGFRFDGHDDEDDIVAALERQGVDDARGALGAYLQEPSEIDAIAEMEKFAAAHDLPDVSWLYYRK